MYGRAGFDNPALYPKKEKQFRKLVEQMIEKIHHGSNLDVLKTYPDNYFDSVVTDPPYGISFMGKKWDYDVPSVELWQEVFRVLKPGGHMLVACGTRTQHRMAVNIENAGFEIRDIVAWVYGSGFPKSMDISKALDKHLGAEREVIGKSDNARPNSKKENNLYQAGTVGKDFDITAPSTEQAKQWQGWGTALKPSMELWTLARKPLKDTVAQNILEYGVGGLNIDGCRISFEDTKNPATNPKYRYENNYKMPEKGQNSSGVVNFTSSKNDTNVNGRFPANFIHDGSDEVEKLFPLENEESPSRFFYVPKASQEERNFGLEGFVKKQKVFNGQSDKPSKEMKGVEAKFTTKPKANIHPTVKPIELMRYLVKMITPQNGICLDPYLGSGTTAIACEMEKFNYIGIELDEQYVEIAKARVSAVKDYEISLDTKTAIKESIKEDKDKELGILNIFDFMEGEIE